MNFGYNPEISKLPIEIQELAFQRQREQGNSTKYIGPIETSKSRGNFNWVETPEEKFWIALNHGDDISNHPDNPIMKVPNYQIY